MCGFAGVVHWDQEDVPAEELNRMLQLLKHRGPDELRVSSPKSNVGLAHARLRVIDLSQAASQPMSNEEQSVWLLYNGEIYNFRELRAELESKGIAFRSRSDTEVILRCYEAWGPEAVRRLDGMFALALWDGRRNELLLARDRAGKKPLFYWTDGRCLVFGSEIKALLAHSHVPREVNESALPFLLAFGYPPTGQTCYRGIRQMPPASFALFSNQNTDPTPRLYWDLRSAPSRKTQSFESAVAECRRLVTAAVQKRLIADVPLGAFLSGGVDSTIIVGLMTQLNPGRPVKTFSIGFEGDPRFNETRYARIAAEKFHSDHTVFTVTPHSFDLIEKLVWHYDQPFGDSSALPTYLLAQLTREHVTVAVSGDGGDECFAGYLRFCAALWSERLPQPVRVLAGKLLGGLPAGNSRAPLARIKRFAAESSLPPLERYLRWIAYLRDPSRELSPWMSEIWDRSKGQTLLSRLLDLNFREYLPNDLLVKADRCSMAHGLETRSPFLDTALLEFAVGLPDRFKISGGQTKFLLKRCFGDLLPKPIQRRGKMGFGVPLGTWFRGQWRAPLRDLLESPQARIGRYLEKERVSRLIRRHLQGQSDEGQPLWLLLTLEIWLRAARLLP